MTPISLRRFRRRHKLSQASLAHLIGVAPNSVARMEAGSRPIREPIARLLLLVFDDLELRDGERVRHLATVRRHRAPVGVKYIGRR